jgi:hypothetical protein
VISFFLSDWLVARFLDTIVKGEDIPDTMAVYGIALLVVAACTLTALVTRAVMQGRLEDDEPEVETPARSADVTEEIPRFVADRMATERRGRRPGPRHRAHLVPAHPPRSGDDTTVVIPVTLGGDPDATAVLPAGGGRRG